MVRLNFHHLTGHYPAGSDWLQLLWPDCAYTFGHVRLRFKCWTISSALFVRRPDLMPAMQTR
jgi:hypothetical protein